MTPGRGRSRETRRDEIEAHFAEKQREKPKMWNGRVLLGRNPVFAGDRFSASYFETDFASFLAWRDWGFPDEASSTVLAWARCAPPTAPSCSARWASTPRMPGASIFRPARPTSTTSGTACSTFAGSVARELEEETGLTPADYRADADWHCIYTGLGRDDPDPARRYAGRSVARAGSRPISPGSDQPELSAHPSGARRERSHRGNAALCRRPSSKRSCPPDLRVQALQLLDEA